MKFLATFDGSPFAEAIMPTLQLMAALPGAEFTLVAVADAPNASPRRGPRRMAGMGDMVGRASPVVVKPPEPGYAETREQAIDRRRAELEDYLMGLASKLPKGVPVHVEAHISSDAAAMIIECAREDPPAAIVMATHGRSGLAHALFGSTTEQVVRAGVAPVLLVRPAVGK